MSHLPHSLVSFSIELRFLIDSCLAKIRLKHLSDLHVNIYSKLLMEKLTQKSNFNDLCIRFKFFPSLAGCRTVQTWPEVSLGRNANQ